MAQSGIGLSALEEEVLTLVAGKKLYGKEIIDAIAEISNGARPAFQGTYYPIFKKLEQQNFLASEWGDSNLGARRKYYQITSEGLNAIACKQAYRGRLHEWNT